MSGGPPCAPSTRRRPASPVISGAVDAPTRRHRTVRVDGVTVPEAYPGRPWRSARSGAPRRVETALTVARAVDAPARRALASVCEAARGVDAPSRRAAVVLAASGDALTVGD